MTDEKATAKKRTTKKAVKPNLYQRLSAIQEAIGSVEKKGTNRHSNYTYIAQTDLVQALQGLFVEHGVQVMFGVVDVETKQVQSAKGKPNLLSTVITKYTFINVDDPEERFETLSAGDGMDVGDKAIYKAFTGADKYLFRNMFLIGGTDDPETDSPEIGADLGAQSAPVSNGQAKREQAQGRPQIQQGGSVQSDPDIF